MDEVTVKRRVRNINGQVMNEIVARAPPLLINELFDVASEKKGSSNTLN